MNSGMPNDVQTVFRSFPDEARRVLLSIREDIFLLAQEECVGPLTEALRWGEPAYLTEATRAGSTIRLGWKERDPQAVFVFFICTTSLVDEMRECVGDRLEFEGNRAIRLPLSAAVDRDAVRFCLRMALTYKRDRSA